MNCVPLSYGYSSRTSRSCEGKERGGGSGCPQGRLCDPPHRPNHRQSVPTVSELEAQPIAHSNAKELEEAPVRVEEAIDTLHDEDRDEADHAGAPVQLLREVAEAHHHGPPDRLPGGLRHPSRPHRRQSVPTVSELEAQPIAHSNAKELEEAP